MSSPLGLSRRSKDHNCVPWFFLLLFNFSSSMFALSWHQLQLCWLLYASNILVSLNLSQRASLLYASNILVSIFLKEHLSDTSLGYFILKEIFKRTIYIVVSSLPSMEVLYLTHYCDPCLLLIWHD